jgi:hypothetical protein
MKSTKTKQLTDANGNVFSLLFGRRELAKYSNTPIHRYQGNPLIEALPPILTEAETSNALAYYPRYAEADRKLAPEHRIHQINTILDLLVAFPEHLDLAERFSLLILGGYTARNPIAIDHWRSFRSRIDELSESNCPRPRVRSSARGMTILGISGAGKTTATEAILDLYPQVIQHSEYKGKPFTWTQIVWLKLQCPFDGSTRGLCLNFFQAVDELIGTNHYRNYAQGRRSTDELMPAMARVGSLHSIGLILLDELQHLLQSNIGGQDRMLNFFTQLVNTIGIPTVFVGTPKAKSLLSQEFRQGRRGTGEGDFVWDQFQNDDKWTYFMEALWTYQYLRKPADPSKELFDIMYDESQGIVDIAVKLFRLSQVRAIRTAQETLNPTIIRSVAKDSFRTIQTALNALRSGKYEVLAEIPDIQPIDYDSAARKIANSSRLASLPGRRLAQTAPESRTPESTASTPSACEANTESVLPSARLSSASTDTLMGIVKKANGAKLDAHTALKAQGLVRDSAEYLPESAPK